jgi:hypothetical protein
MAPKHAQWQCPLCESVDEDNFHVVTPLRNMADAWLQAIAMAVDATAGILE